MWTVGPGLGQGRETFLQGDLDLTRPLKREPPSHHPGPWPAQSPGAPGSYWMGNGRVLFLVWMEVEGGLIASEDGEYKTKD